MGITPAYAGKSHSPRTPGARAPGSPPRMRGKVRSVACSMTSPVDHPRVCGEKHGVHVSLMWSAGSPPRMRGKARKPCSFTSCIGITPAYAGKSTFHVFPDGLPWDHPRVCGEKERVSRCACWSEGSPPRMRGKEPGTLRTVRVSRITPAYAGKRKPIKMAKKRARDHPRVCGEKKKHNMWW